MTRIRPGGHDSQLVLPVPAFEVPVAHFSQVVLSVFPSSGEKRPVAHDLQLD